MKPVSHQVWLCYKVWLRFCTPEREPPVRLVKWMSQAPFPKGDMFVLLICSHIYRFTKHSSFFFFTDHITSEPILSWPELCGNELRRWRLPSCSLQILLAASTRDREAATALSSWRCATTNQCNAPLGKSRLMKQKAFIPSMAYADWILITAKVPQCLLVEWWKDLHQSPVYSSLTGNVVKHAVHLNDTVETKEEETKNMSCYV